MFSTFKEDMRVQRITSLSKDRTIFFEAFDSENAPVIKSGALSDLGRLYFIPKANCSDDCYVGKDLLTSKSRLKIYQRSREFLSILNFLFRHTCGMHQKNKLDSMSAMMMVLCAETSLRSKYSCSSSMMLHFYETP